MYLNLNILKDNPMKAIISALALILGLSTNLWAAVQTDTHTYIVSENENSVLAINRQTGEETKIPVGRHPRSMVIHGGMGYVVNEYSYNVSVIDLTLHKEAQTIPVGNSPQSMVIHGGMGYVVNYGPNTISVLDLKSNTVTQTISVGERPQSMVIHGGMGYVVNYGSNTVSVLDLKSNTVTQTISVGERPQSMVIHGGMGYVVNSDSYDVSVLDLITNRVTQTISVGSSPRSMVIHGEVGYVMNYASDDVSVIDLQTNSVITTFKNPNDTPIDFSDTHIYFGLKKDRPHYPTLSSISLAKAQRTLGEFVAIMPDVFQLGEFEQRKFPKERNEFDTLPLYLLAQKIFWDVNTDMPLMDPQDILATLITMKYPQRFLQTVPGKWLRKRLHMAFFQTVWLGEKDKAKTMLKYFVQLQDPVITILAAYTFKAAKKSSDQKATNSTDLS